MGRTSRVYFLNCLLDGPLYALFGFMAFILVREAGATPFQIAVLISAKPVMAVFSSWWSARVRGRRKFLVWACLLAGVPTLLFPFVNSIWYYVGALMIYILSERAAMPIWMELVHRHGDQQRNQLVSRSLLVKFLVESFFPICACWYMDLHPGSWKWVFAALSAVSLLRVALVAWARFDKREIEPRVLSGEGMWSLIKERPDFLFFQSIFWFGGMGIMMWQAALPSFTASVNFSLFKLSIGVALCKGVGYALASPLWQGGLKKMNLYLFCGLVAAVAALSGLLTPLGQVHHVWIYLALGLYGVMQAGSQMGWQLSGPMFAGGQDSARYSSLNVLSVGMRGFIGPSLGSLVMVTWGLHMPFYVGGAVCLVGTACGLIGSRIYGKRTALT